ncbi:MAG: GDP-mannose 4,6-dehydratase, partial [Planctomycetota bacterium]
YEIINLGGGKNPVSLQKIIGRLEELLGKKAVIDNKAFHIADIKETWADIAKAERLLGWRPTVGLEEGLKRSVTWYRATLEWAGKVKL